MSVQLSFGACFKAITGYDPLRWQVRLFDRIVSSGPPKICDLPTGLGKTSMIPIWLIAIALQDQDSGNRPLPRRLVYIVNRRTVVDQATEVVEAMRARLRNPHDDRWSEHREVLHALWQRLQTFAADMSDDGLGVSTLRGELADNEEWKADPVRPAVVVGTIDMVGSKLLFSGYGDGRYLRAHHAGLIGQDVLLVHDEAHLTPAFDNLLRSIMEEQQREAERSGRANGIARPIQVVSLSATSRHNSDDTFTLEMIVSTRSGETNFFRR